MTRPYIVPFPDDPKYLRAVEENVDPNTIYALHTGNAVPLRSHAGGDELVRWFDYVFMRYQLVAQGNAENAEYWQQQQRKYGAPAGLATAKAALIEAQLKSMAGYLLTAMARLFRARIRGAGEIPLDIEPTTRAFLTGKRLVDPATGYRYRVPPTLNEWFREGEAMMADAARSIEEWSALPALGGGRSVSPRVLADFSTPESVFAPDAGTMGAAPAAAAAAPAAAAWTGWQAAVYIVGIVAAVGAVTMIAMGIAALSTVRPVIDEMLNTWRQNADAFDTMAASCEAKYADQPEALADCLQRAMEQRDESNQRTTDAAMGAVGEVLDATVGETARAVRSSAWAGAFAAIGIAAAFFLFSRGD